MQRNKRLRVLVLDDCIELLDSLRQLLDTDEFETRCVESPEAALALVTPRYPDVFLVDIGLPGVTGWDIGRLVQKLSACRVVALTGFGQDADIARSKQLGFFAHLVKPVEPDLLIRELRRAAATPSRYSRTTAIEPMS